jgi:hypothetical protein
MRIVNRKTFLEYAPGTLYSKYQPCVFEDLQIKHESCNGNDWFYSGYQALEEGYEGGIE